MITNFGGVILGCIILKYFRFNKSSGLAVMFFCFMEVIIHILISIQDLGIFYKYGGKIIL